MTPWLEIRGLGFAWPDQPALFTAFNASADPGLCLLLGGEQTGKSSLLHLLAGERSPDTGSVWLAGRALGAGWVGWRPDMGLPDLDGVRAGHWLREQVTTGPARERLETAVDGLSLREHLPKTFHMLSTGGRRKVGLAAAMALQAPLTLLDQPFAALDLPSVRCLTQWLARQADASDRLVLLADHEAPAGLTLAQRIDLG